MVFSGEPTKRKCTGPYPVNEGMNKLLEYLNITIRRDKDSKPRINKLDSVLDKEQNNPKILCLKSESKIDILIFE